MADTSCCRRRESARGFTLVEMLVVLGIIAVLLALLLPALSAVRQRSRDANCLSNQRQIGIAAAAWTAEHDGFLPLAGNIRLPPGASGVGSLPNALNDPGRRRYAYVATPPGSGPPTGEILPPLPAALSPAHLEVDEGTAGDVLWSADRMEALDSTAALFRCPAAPEGAASAQHIRLEIDGVFYVMGWDVASDYAFNEGLLGFEPDLATLPRRGRGQIARVRDASRTVFLADADHGARESPLFCWTPTAHAGSGEAPVTLAEVLTGSQRILRAPAFDHHRHRGNVNVLFVDGHASARRIDADALESVVITSE